MIPEIEGEVYAVRQNPDFADTVSIRFGLSPKVVRFPVDSAGGFNVGDRVIVKVFPADPEPALVMTEPVDGPLSGALAGAFA